MRKAETVNISWKLNILCSADLVGRTELEAFSARRYIESFALIS